MLSTSTLFNTDNNNGKGDKLDIQLAILCRLDVQSLLTCRLVNRALRALIDQWRNSLPKFAVEELQLFGGHGTWRISGQDGKPFTFSPQFVNGLKNLSCARLRLIGDVTESNYSRYFDAAVTANQKSLQGLLFERSALNAVKFLSKYTFRQLKVLHLRDVPVVHGKYVTDELFDGLEQLEELFLLPRWNSDFIWENTHFPNVSDKMLAHLSSTRPIRLKNITLWSCNVTANGVLQFLLEWMKSGATDLTFHVKMCWIAEEKQLFVRTLRMFCSHFDFNDFAYEAVCGQNRLKLEMSL